MPTPLHDLRRRAHEARREGRMEEALRLYEKAVARARDQNDPLLLAHTLRHAADLQREAGHPNDAEPAYDEVLALYRRHDDGSVNMANALRGSALCKEALEQRAEARTLWTQAREIYRAAGIDAGMEECDARIDPPAADGNR